ncbi:hypothetical protein [Lactobacillus delbrueckii]|uniref:hypothetical protein n=1 Tax=Lactobacillus delbrueckii TaxID=1584 RepID=UPI000ACA06EA|nr:hypothetical protein [Lactobacillus delbrueckii]MCD5452290.1 hypothetical protein [Lactobacillus delbrueckii subsp. lactis]
MIKLIAFDMDESFMPRKGFYERERWARDFDLLRAKETAWHNGPCSAGSTIVISWNRLIRIFAKE